MVDVKTEIIIACPVETVAAYAGNPENAPHWYVNIKKADRLPNGGNAISVGSKIAFGAHFLGKKLSYVYEIVELIPLKKLVMRTADGPFPMETTYEWESLDDNSTLMKLRNTGIPSGFSKWFAPFMVSAMKKANKKDLKLLKQILEV